VPFRAPATPGGAFRIERISSAGVKLRRFLQTRRRSPFSRWIARRAERLLLAYRNFDYDMSRNGELWLIGRLTGVDRPVLYDVGANHGHWTMKATEILPGAEVHCFEICPTTFTKLEANLRGRAGVRLNPFGLSNEHGMVEFKYFPQDDGKTSLFDYPHPKKSLRVTGEVRPGDEHMRASGTTRVHLLKIDTEGAEHLVLGGLTEALATHRIDLIQFEYGRVNILSRFLLKDYYDLLSGHGYVVGKLYPGYVDFKAYVLEDEDFLGPNYVACRNDLHGLIEILKG
jgi:FkbM family methyltransferase